MPAETGPVGGQAPFSRKLGDDWAGRDTQMNTCFPGVQFLRSFQTELGGPPSRLEHTFSEVGAPRPDFQGVSQRAGEAGRD